MKARTFWLTAAVLVVFSLLGLLFTTSRKPMKIKAGENYSPVVAPFTVIVQPDYPGRS